MIVDTQKIFKKAQIKLLEVKTTMFEMKNTLESINRRLAITEEKIREYGEIAIKTTIMKHREQKD